ncbi:hypothetical protein [Pseudarthrobacter sp. SSS035]|uniref:hypothetical protein n=1 Tax=Pseudarthrobacter sp. SSS035 TaxID=2931399 RepID=UPI00200FE4D1|nr:hypothetical protein [Pseudarthrobacter sp. SSS035]
MNRIGFAARCSAVAAGTALLLGVAGMAMAEENHGEQDVDVNVGITEPAGLRPSPTRHVVSPWVGGLRSGRVIRDS